MSTRPPIQPLTDRIPIINGDGTPTNYFIRYLQERGIDLDTKVTPEEVAQMILDWSEARSINAVAPIVGGGTLDANVSIGHDVSGVTPGVYGDATNVAQVTVDEYGHVTDVVEVPITGGGGGGGIIYRPQIEGIPANSVSLVGTQIFTPVYLTAGDEVTGIATAASAGITMNAGGALYGPTGLVAFGAGFNLVADSGIASATFTANVLKIFPVTPYTVPTTGRYWISIYAGSAYSAFARPGSGIMYKTGTLTSFPSTTAAPTNTFTAGGTGFLVGTFA